MGRAGQAVRSARALRGRRRPAGDVPCFCTRAEIREAPSAPHAPPGWYPGTCRDRTDRAGGNEYPAALRLRSDDPAVDDFVVRRNDGAFAYNLATVVDDGELGVEEVVRGGDLADTTGRQQWLARALGFEPPAFVHVGLVVGADGQRLAKRHGVGHPARGSIRRSRATGSSGRWTRRWTSRSCSATCEVIAGGTVEVRGFALSP